MTAYRLTLAAKEDLRRIYTYDCQQWGKEAAEHYYNALFDRFEQIATQPILIQLLITFVPDTDVACVV